MDGVSVAGSILAIGTARAELAIKLVAFASQVNEELGCINLIVGDISIIASLLPQLKNLINVGNENPEIDIWNKGGLKTMLASVNACHRVIQDLEETLNSASQLLRAKSSKTV